MFLTAYGNERKKVNTPTGSKIEPEYGYKINKHGQKVLTQTGETNVYNKIQEYLEETKIENVLARVANGDTSALRPDGMYIDVTQMPNNLLEAREQMHMLEETWNKLPKEIKDKYDNDLESFIGQSGTDKWLEDMGIIEKGVKNEQEHGTTLLPDAEDRHQTE